MNDLFINNCAGTAIEALRHLAVNPRPSHGNERFNAEHLYMLADELEKSLANVEEKIRLLDLEAEHSMDHGLDLARKGVQRVDVHEDAPDLPDDWYEEPFANVVWSYNSGDPDVGIPAVSGWVLAADQSGTIVERLLKQAMAGDEVAESFQEQVHPWMLECFGREIAGDRAERNHRFLEEAIELVQACGCTRSEAHQLVDYVFNRPIGERPQEVGGVMVTLAALCLAHDMDMHDAGDVELARIWTKVEQIRAKQAAKPKHSPLPE